MLHSANRPRIPSQTHTPPLPSSFFPFLILPQPTKIRPHNAIHPPPQPPIPPIPVLIPLPVLRQHGAVAYQIPSPGGGAAGDEPGQDRDFAEDALGEGRLGEEGVGDGAQDGFADGGEGGHVFR